MKIKIRNVIKNYQGNSIPFKDSPEDKERDMIVRDALNNVLNGTEIDQQGRAKPETKEAKGRIYQLSTKLWSVKKEIKLSTEEGAFIKKRASLVANITPLIYGRICDIIEGKNEEKNKDNTGKATKAKA